MPDYSRTSDPNVISVLERGDIFLGTRRYLSKGEWKEKQFKYRVLYPGVYFGHSGNWTIRCKGRFAKKLREEFEVVEHIVVNHECVSKYRFNVGHIMAARAQAMKRSLSSIKALKPNTPKKKKPQLTEKPKLKLSQLRVKV